MAEKIFVDGRMYKAPRPNAPDFVKGSFSVKVVDNIKFMLKQCEELDLHNPFIVDFIKHIEEKIPAKWLNEDFLKSKKGTFYLALNNWKPTPKGEVGEQDIDKVIANLTDNKMEALAQAEAKAKQAIEDAQAEDPSKIPF